jgi:hypothetical protein
MDGVFKLSLKLSHVYLHSTALNSVIGAKIPPRLLSPFHLLMRSFFFVYFLHGFQCLPAKSEANFVQGGAANLIISFSTT